MIKKYRNLVFWASSIYLLAPFAFMLPANAELSQEAAQDISRQAYAILKNNCFACHGATMTSGLDLRTGESVRSGGEGGPVIVPFKANESRLYLYITHAEKPSMPPGKKLPDAEIETLRRWIESGASFDGFENTIANAPDEAKARAGSRASSGIDERPITPEDRRYWAFQQPQRTKPSLVRKSGWDKNPIDSFLLTAMSANGLRPSPQADRRTLIRRASWT
jgi:mono/diheme cytochrome c family protein